MEDFSSVLLAPDEPTAQERAQALASALRRQQAAGLMGQLTGDKVLGGVGTGLVRGAQDQQEQLNQAPSLRQTLLQHRVKTQADQAAMDEANTRRTSLADPNSTLSTTRLELARRFGMKVPEGAPGSAVDDKELGFAEKATQAELAAKNHALNASFVNSTRQDQFNKKREDQLSTGLQKDLDEYNARGGLKNYMDAINRAGKIDALLTDPATGKLNKVIDNRQMAELAMALQQLVASGHASQSQVEHLIPHNLWGDVARAEEYFTGKPADAGQQAFAQQLLHSAHIEAQKGKAQVGEALRKRIPRYAELNKLNPILFESMLEGHGINRDALDDRGILKPGMDFMIPDPSAEPAASTAALPSPKNQAEYDALPSGAQYLKNGKPKVKK